MLKRSIFLVALKRLSLFALNLPKFNPSMDTSTKLKLIILEGELIDREGNYLLIRISIPKKLLISNIHFYYDWNEIVVHSKDLDVKLGDKVRVKGYIRENQISPSIENATVKRIDKF
ncbi:hypothetical protein OCF61_29970 [Bacillus cereus]|nr:hypothetical protein [Bacillus cereus]